MLNASLANLGMDYVDLYIYHMWDYRTPLYEIMKGLNKTAEQDKEIIDRVAEPAKRRGVTMTEISLAWLLTKVSAPVVGATKIHHIDGAAKATELSLTNEEIAYLEEPYVPHNLVGVMAENK